MERDCGRLPEPLAPATLARLQRDILGDTALVYGVRRSPVYVGHPVRYEPVVDYIAPHWDEVPALLAGLATMLERTHAAAPIVRAALASFGFVYVHPMADGNGRISRFLINDVLRRDQALPAPLIIDAWYDDTLRTALAAMRSDWAEVQGLSQSEHFGTWTGWYGPQGQPLDDAAAPATLLYKPWGGHAPAGNYLVSDSDFVEVLTEIDIQTPIPALVQQRRAGLGFLFLGCRFNDQLPRAFARQILKRSGGPHFAVLPEEPTRMERRFLEETGITRIAQPLHAVAAELCGHAALAA